MAKQRTIKQQADYHIVARRDGFAVYDKHSRFRVICPTLADATAYVNEHSKRAPAPRRDLYAQQSSI